MDGPVHAAFAAEAVEGVFVVEGRLGLEFALVGLFLLFLLFLLLLSFGIFHHIH